MLPVVAFVFLVVPLVELAVIIQVSQAVGILETIGLLIVVSVVGAGLAKREGLGVLRRVRTQLDAGHLPGDELIDGFLVLFAAALLLTPGFLTDCLAISLLLAPVRAFVRRVLRGFLARRVVLR